MAVLTKEEAHRTIAEGRDGYSIFLPSRVEKLFNDYDEANECADELSEKHNRPVHVLDWATGDYV